MNFNRAQFMILLCIAPVSDSALLAMGIPPLMPPFELSTAAQELVDWGGFYVRRGNPRVSALDKRKTDLYLAAWTCKDYPQTMERQVREEVLLHLDVMQALLHAATQERDYSRNDYITVFFIAAARTGNINALTFFLGRGVKINEIGYFGKSALDVAMENGQEEAITLLLSQGAIRNKLPVKKIG